MKAILLVHLQGFAELSLFRETQSSNTRILISLEFISLFSIGELLVIPLEFLFSLVHPSFSAHLPVWGKYQFDKPFLEQNFTVAKDSCLSKSGELSTLFSTQIQTPIRSWTQLPSYSIASLPQPSHCLMPSWVQSTFNLTRSSKSVTRENLGIHYGSQGIAQLRYNDVTLIDPQFSNQSSLRVANYKLRDASGMITSFNGDQNRVDVWGTANTVNWEYTWGTVTATYLHSGNRLNITVNVVNRSRSDTVEQIEIWPITLNFPTLSDLGTGVEWGINGPPVKVADFSRGVVAVANLDSSQPLTIGYYAGGAHSVEINTGLPWYLEGNSPRIYRPIPPRTSDQFRISLRFGPSDATAFELAPDVYHQYAKAFPVEFNWSDRRPLGRLIPASHVYENDFKTNPRGWFNDSSINIFTSSGLQQFRTRLMVYADQSIANLKSINAQGVILWDMEGEQYQDISYVGDPRLVGRLAPEMNEFIDEFFQRFQDAGLRVGVTIRPQQVRGIREGGRTRLYQDNNVDVFTTLNSKIIYAKARWGVSLFYIDSNSPALDTKPDGTSVLQQLTKAHPDVLLIPEHETPRTYAYAAPYNGFKQWYYEYSSIEARRELYPKAFQVLQMSDRPLNLEDYQEAVDRVRAGDILMVDAWYSHPGQAVIRQVYHEANRSSY